MTRRAAAIAGACLAVQVALSVHAMRGNSATFDEGAHLPAGYTHLALGDHRLNPEQPPLAKLLAAAPLLAVAPTVRETDVAWRSARQWEFGRRFLYRWNDGRRLLFLGRLPMVTLAALLVLAIFVEARRRFGDVAGCAAAGLAALSPDVLAHGTLVTTDVPFALFFFIAAVAFARLLEEVRPGRLLAAGLATGAAFATKFSAPILVLVLAAIAIAAALRPEPLAWRVGRSRSLDGAARRLGVSLALLLVIGFVALAVVWAAYGFRHDLSPDAGVRTAQLALEEPASSSWSRALAAASGLGVLPEDYVRGFRFVMAHSQGRSTFLLGELSEHGFPHYFLVTFLLKTPVPLLLLTLVALVRVRHLSRPDALFVWLPVAIYAGLTFTRSLQIGHRHLLPIYPFLFVAAGEAVASLVASRRRIAGRVAVLALAAWSAGAALWIHPHHLAYFNELAGGPANGWRLLVDSNLDWGQDLGRLGEWMRANGVARLKLSYFGSAEPAYHGVDAEMLPGYMAPHPAQVTRAIAPGDVVAVSVTNLQGVYVDPVDRPLMAKLRALEPIGRVGWSIRVYRADFSWPEPSSP